MVKVVNILLPFKITKAKLHSSSIFCMWQVAMQGPMKGGRGGKQCRAENEQIQRQRKESKGTSEVRRQSIVFTQQSRLFPQKVPGLRLKELLLRRRHWGTGTVGENSSCWKKKRVLELQTTRAKRQTSYAKSIIWIFSPFPSFLKKNITIVTHLFNNDSSE